MNKAAQLCKELEPLKIEEGLKVIEKSYAAAIWFEPVGDVMSIMHDDGSVNLIEHRGHGVITCEVISAANVLKVLRHYRPFNEVFKGNIQ
jgi:hypothetical protein